LIFKHCNVFSC